VSWDPENSGPTVVVVKFGSTRQVTAKVMTVARAAPVPSALKWVAPNFTAPTSRQSPTIPLQVIMTAAKTVSRASVEVSLPPLSMSVRISATSMTVTATARTRDPNGSPTRWATTSAWCTAASTAVASSTATRVRPTAPGWRPQVTASASSATGGATSVQLRALEWGSRIPGAY
jgi:hypothetical protein